MPPQDLVFDIETGPTDNAADYFDESKVKLGNLKDPEKIKAKVEEARQEFLDKAALSAVTGQVLAIGYRRGDSVLIRDGREWQLLNAFWKLFKDLPKHGIRHMIGHNIFAFDLPFLIQRSWRWAIPIPAGVIEKDRYWSRVFVDTMARFGCGVYGAKVSLDNLARFFGIEGKPDGVTGADFAKLWETDRKTAEEYLRNDLNMTWEVAKRLGVINGN
jgi:hypothetical protein